MRKLHINNYLLFFFISFIFTVYFVGLNNFWFTKVDWLYGSGDYTNSQLSPLVVYLLRGMEHRCG